MEVQTIKRPKCRKNESGDGSDSKTSSKSFKRSVIKGLKWALVRLVVRPVVFKWLLVHVPIAIEKTEHTLKDIFELFIDIF